MKKRWIYLCAVLAVLFFLIILGAAYLAFFPNTNNRSTVILTLPANADFEQMTDSMSQYKLLKSEQSFRVMAKCMQFHKVKPGKYAIAPSLSNLNLVRILRRGQHYPVKFVFHDVRTVEQIIAKTKGKFLFSSEELRSLLDDEDFLASYHFDNQTLPAMFIPDSYELYYDITDTQFFKKMFHYYELFWNKERLERADNIGLTPIEVSTLASIVEEENHREAEKAVIAGLYMNRLHKGMLLQADPTVKFAVGDFTLKRILKEHTQIDSPYNTYRHVGLPPGPIRVPAKSSIDSVLHYRHHNYLYMCAKEDLSGSHNFAVSADEHYRNAEKYHRALNRLSKK